MNEPQGALLSAAACDSSSLHFAYTALRLYFGHPRLTVTKGTRIPDEISNLGAKRTFTRFVIFKKTRVLAAISRQSISHVRRIEWLGESADPTTSLTF